MKAKRRGRDNSRYGVHDLMMLMSQVQLVVSFIIHDHPTFEVGGSQATYVNERVVSLKGSYRFQARH